MSLRVCGSSPAGRRWISLSERERDSERIRQEHRSGGYGVGHRQQLRHAVHALNDIVIGVRESFHAIGTSTSSVARWWGRPPGLRGCAHRPAWTFLQDWLPDSPVCPTIPPRFRNRSVEDAHRARRPAAVGPARAPVRGRGRPPHEGASSSSLVARRAMGHSLTVAAR
jgi:hypothetical protein